MSDALTCQELSFDELTDIVGGTDKAPAPTKQGTLESYVEMALQNVLLSNY